MPLKRISHIDNIIYFKEEFGLNDNLAINVMLDYLLQITLLREKIRRLYNINYFVFAFMPEENYGSLNICTFFDV